MYDTVYPKFGEHFAQAMNSIGSQYFSREGYDKLYPGYGSSHVNFYGGIGFLFEQASTRGHLQQTSTVPLTFTFTIRNQVTASLASVKASLVEKDMLLKLRRDFYKAASSQAKASHIKAYVFGDSYNQTRTNAFANFAKSPYATVAQYTASPLIGGYLQKSNTKKIANSAAIVVSNEGQGKVILFSDNPNFRGIWYGTNKLFLNAFFFGSIITTPSMEGGSEE